MDKFTCDISGVNLDTLQVRITGSPACAGIFVHHVIISLIEKLEAMLKAKESSYQDMIETIDQITALLQNETYKDVVKSRIKGLHDSVTAGELLGVANELRKPKESDSTPFLTPQSSISSLPSYKSTDEPVDPKHVVLGNT